MINLNKIFYGEKFAPETPKIVRIRTKNDIKDKGERSFPHFEQDSDEIISI